MEADATAVVAAAAAVVVAFVANDVVDVAGVDDEDAFPAVAAVARDGDDGDDDGDVFHENVVVVVAVVVVELAAAAEGRFEEALLDASSRWMPLPPPLPQLPRSDAAKRDSHRRRNCTTVRTDLWRLAQQRIDEAAADKFLDLVEEAAAVVVAVAVAEVATEWRPRDNVAVA